MYRNMPRFTYTCAFFLCPCPCSVTHVDFNSADLWKVGRSGPTCFHVEALRYDDLCHMDPFTGGIKIPLQLEDAS